MIKILLILSQEFILAITCYQFQTDKHTPNFVWAGLKNCHMYGQATANFISGRGKKRFNPIAWLRSMFGCTHEMVQSVSIVSLLSLPQHYFKVEA